MRRLALLLLLCATLFFATPALGAVGGPTAPPPFQNTTGSNLVANPTFATSLASWGGSCGTWDGTTTHTADGSGSDKITCNSTGATTILSQTVPTGTNQEGELVSVWVKTDSSFNGVLSFSFFDNTHGDGSMLAAAGRTVMQVNAGSTSWQQIGTEIFPNEFLHSGDQISVRLSVTGQTAGTIWLDDASVVDEWYPIHNFVTSVYNQDGIVWTDKAPTEHNLAGIGLDINPNPVVGEISGIAELHPPVGQALSGTTLVEVLNTRADCTGTNLGTKTYASPAAQQVWAFNPADYGGIPAVGTTDYVCPSLEVTSGPTLIATYPSFAVVFEDATFRTTLNNYSDGDDAFVHKGLREFVIGVYDRLSGGNRCSVCIWSSGASGTPAQATAEQVYIHNQQGPGDSRIGPASSVLGHGPENIASYAASFFNLIMGDIIGMSTVCPNAVICSGDQLSPWLDALDSIGAAHAQIVNNWYHCLVSGEPYPCPAPTFSLGTYSTGAGSITASTFDIEATAVVYNQPSGSAQFPEPLETNPSSAVAVPLSSKTCAGVNCSITFTTPTCINWRQSGWYIYGSEDGVTYQRQYPSFSGQVFGAYAVPCGQTITLTTFQTTGITLTSAAITSISRSSTTVTATLSSPLPLVKGLCVSVSGVTDSANFPNGVFGIGTVPNNTTLNYTESGTSTSSSGGTAVLSECASSSPVWQNSSTTDATVYSDIATTMANAAGGAHPGNGVFYVADEPLLQSLGSVFNTRQSLDVNLTPLWCTLIDSTAVQQWRDVCDSINNDPYGYGIAADPDDSAMLPSSTARTCSDYTSTFNRQSVATNCNPQRINAWVDATERGTYASRPVWTVLQLFQRGPHLAFNYTELWRQAMEAIIGQKQWGTVGGIIWWGFVSSSGIENAWFTAHNTQAFWDLIKVDSQVHELSPILLQPSQDSPILRAGSGQVDGVSGETVVGGTVVSNVKIDTPVGTACGTAGAGSIYSNTSKYPFGPVGFATVTDSLTGDEYIFANNLCDSTFHVTLTLPNIPSGQTNVEVRYEGREIAISSGTITDTWNSLDPHIYVVRAVRGTQFSQLRPALPAVNMVPSVKAAMSLLGLR